MEWGGRKQCAPRAGYHMHFWLDRSILHTPPHSSIPIILLIKTASQMTGHVSVLKTVPTTSVQRHISQWTSAVWPYTEKRKCAFSHWTPGQRGVGSSSWLKIFTFPKRWQSTSTARFWAQHQKVGQIGKIISGWTKTFSWGAWNQPRTHLHIFWTITV